MADSDKKPEKETGKDSVFGVKLPGWASRARDAVTSSINTEKAKAALGAVEKAARSAGEKATQSSVYKAVSEKATEVAKKAEGMVKKKDTTDKKEEDKK